MANCPGVIPETAAAILLVVERVFVRAEESTSWAKLRPMLMLRDWMSPEMLAADPPAPDRRTDS
ncbi:hypothetical protein, partial [Myxococcus sp. AM009]|uniref:hypothetical protein n=1 Tax=Myxococcus sp. AM009 TaxID=2745137 RepID=UPI001C3E24B5